MRPVTDLQRSVAPFEVVTDMVPAGDQPQAIAQMEKRIQSGTKDTVLLGATGTGKTATVAWLAERLQRPTLVMLPNKTLAAQFANELREMLPHNAVEYFVSYYDYYQPEAYVPQTDTYIEKDSSINDEVERLRHSATNSLLTRRDTIVVASVSCIYGLGTPQEYVDRMLKLQRRRHDRPGRAAAQAGRHAVRPQRPVLHPGHVPGTRRHHRDHPGLRGDRRPDRDVRRRDRTADDAAPADRRGDQRGRRSCTSSPPRTTWRARSGWSGPSRASRSSSPSGWPSWSGPASCSRRSGCGCAPPMTSRCCGRSAAARDRELLAAHRRPRARQPAEHAAGLLPRGLPAGHRRVAQHRPADRRDVRGRRVPEAGPGRPWVPAAQRDRQPAAHLGGVRRPDRPDASTCRPPPVRTSCSGSAAK